MVSRPAITCAGGISAAAGVASSIIPAAGLCAANVMDTLPHNALEGERHKLMKGEDEQRNRG